MIRPLAIILGAFALAGPASASILIYTGAFSGANESPPSGSLGTGFTTVTIDTTLFTMRTEANFTGLGTGTTAAHIHIRPTHKPPMAEWRPNCRRSSTSPLA